ncbi:hypothetical protein QTH73_01140 [Clostridium perfringens]|nr:hypothetical protein [Clostridium perfringens]
MYIKGSAAINIIDENISILEFSKEFSEWLNKSGLLYKKGNTNKLTSKAIFDDNTWIIFEDYSQVYYHIKFDDIDATDDTKIIVKCWLTSLMQEDRTANTVYCKYSSIKRFINETNNFDVEELDNTKGNLVSTILAGLSQRQKSDYIVDLKNYIIFLDSYALSEDGHFKVLHSISNIKTSTKRENKKLPKSMNIIGFEYYLKKFFNEDDYDFLKKLYKPILLWWKITNVIPMRTSEFAFKLKRDCLIKDNSKYYLKIGRVKVDNGSKKGGKIPILSRLEITKEIYDLINDYIYDTSFDKDTKTLLSYQALQMFKKKAMEECSYMCDINFHATKVKNHSDMFNQDNLKSLLKSFYKVVIKGIYDDKKIDEELTLGDTRHLAFSSLALQGVSPIEIAMLGGHTTLNMQVNYSGHIEYYIDCEILDYVSNRNIKPTVDDESLINIIFNKPQVCPRFLADCTPTDDGVGYCTLDLEKDATLCDEVHNCVFCKKWWCEPSNDSYIKVKDFIQNTLVGPLRELIVEEENFLLALMTNAKTVNVSGLLELDSEYETEIRQTRNKLKSDLDQLIALKKSLIEKMDKEIKLI